MAAHCALPSRAAWAYAPAKSLVLAETSGIGLTAGSSFKFARYIGRGNFEQRSETVAWDLDQRWVDTSFLMVLTTLKYHHCSGGIPALPVAGEVPAQIPIDQPDIKPRCQKIGKLKLHAATHNIPANTVNNLLRKR